MRVSWRRRDDVGAAHAVMGGGMVVWDHRCGCCDRGGGVEGRLRSWYCGAM
jgi:hypothetical protein